MLEQLNQVYLSMSVTEPSTLDASSNSSLSPVARVLVQQGKIAEAKAVEIMQQTLQKKSNFIAEVIAAGLIDSAEMPTLWRKPLLCHC